MKIGKHIFLLDIPIWSQVIMVCVNATNREAQKKRVELDRNGEKARAIEVPDIEAWKLEHVNGFVHWAEDLPILVFKDFKDSWFCWELLLHETSHVVDWLMERKVCPDTEARAYTHEWLFRTIRRKLTVK